MIRYTAPLLIGTVIGCATFLFSTSQRVQQEESHLSALRADLAQERQSARVLRAEWDYLNRPDRLETLARQYLNLTPPESGALLSSLEDLKALPEEDPPAPAEKLGVRPGAREAVAEAPLIPTSGPVPAAALAAVSPAAGVPAAVAVVSSSMPTDIPAQASTQAQASALVSGAAPVSEKRIAAVAVPVRREPEERIAVFSAKTPVPPPSVHSRAYQSFDEVLARAGAGGVATGRER